MGASDYDALAVEPAAVRRQHGAWQRLRANWSVRLGAAALALLVAVALAAPWLGTVDPTLFDAASRDLRPGEAGEITTLDGEQIKHTFLMGSDSFGRDIYSRVVYGTRISLLVGVSSALVALTFGILIGLSAGYLRRLDGPLMRVMDGVMAIPAILLAIALVALWKASLLTVIVAIAIPEIPRTQPTKVPTKSSVAARNPRWARPAPPNALTTAMPCTNSTTELAIRPSAASNSACSRRRAGVIISGTSATASATGIRVISVSRQSTVNR